MAPIDKLLTHDSQVVMRCSLQMVYQWTDLLSIHANGANCKASLTNDYFLPMEPLVRVSWLLVSVCVYWTCVKTQWSDCCLCLLCRTKKPCLSTDPSTVCVPTYGFRHILSLVDNPVEFEVCMLGWFLWNIPPRGSFLNLKIALLKGIISLS